LVFILPDISQKSIFLAFQKGAHAILDGEENLAIRCAVFGMILLPFL